MFDGFIPNIAKVISLKGKLVSEFSQSVVRAKEGLD